MMVKCEALSEGFLTSKIIPPAWDRLYRRSDESTPIRFNIKFADGGIIPENVQISDGEKIEFEIRVTFFDITYKQFFGRTWTGPKVAVKNFNACEEVKIRFDHNLYFHTSFADHNIALVLELNAIHNSNTTTKVINSGWTFLRVFQSDNDLRDSSATSPSHSQSLELYNGSPRSLLFLEDPIERNKYLQKVLGCHLHYQLTLHTTLLKVIHILPENILFSGNDTLPGLVAGSKPQNDCLRNLIPDKGHVINIDKVTLSCNNVEKLEDELCHLMNEDRLNREHLSPDGSELTVSERRLQIGVHNGWSYIQEPQIHHLVSDAVVSSNNVSRNTLLPSGHVRSSSTTSRFSDSSSLMLRNKVELRDVPENCFIVFLLEYVLSFPITMLDRRPSSTASVSRGSTMSVAVCWCRWLPDDKREESEISLTLVGGPAHNLDSLLLYRNTLINDGDSMKLNFEFSVSSSPKKIRRESTIGHAYLSDNESLPDTVDSKPLPSSIMKSQNVASREPASCPSIVSSAEMAPTVVQRRYETEDDDLIDRTSHPNDIYLPIIPALPGKPSLSQPQLTRIGYSQLYSIGFPNIVDRHGKPPHIVEFRSDRRFETKKELRDSLKCNEIVIELLAMSGSGQISSTQSVLFAFQFYRFPSTSTGRLHLGSSSSKSHDSSSHPYILYKTNKNGTKKNPDDPGFQIKYDVNNDFLYDDKEHETFVNYLQSQFLLIDVWDAESLFFVGTAAVPLKFLCRQGREAVQCLACDLDVRKNRYLNATDISQTRDVECRLHVRLANVGRPLDLDALKKKSLRKKTGCAEVIRPMIEKDRQLSKLLESFSRNVRETASSEKTRKLARMEALRSAKGIPNNPSVNGTGECNARDKLKDLKIIADYRDKYKDEVIRGVLCRSICTDYVLYPVLGNSYVIVHPVVNDTAQPTNVIVESLKSSLRVVTDYKEWLNLKELFDLNVNVEENTFIADDDAATANGQIKFYLRSKETILVPFVYQRIKFTHVTSASVLEVPTTVVTPTDRIKVSFVTNPDGKILSMTNINVRSQPINCDLHYTFYHAESSSFKTYVEIPKNLTGRFSVRASDADVICSVEKGRKPHQQHVFVKASCSGGADSSMTFYLFLYSERYCHRAVYSWKITVHLLEKVDVRCVAGQTCRTSLVLRGEQITRQVRAYSSNVNEMAVEPSRPFILPAGAVQEIRVGIRVLDAGSRYMQVNVVDDETPKLIKSWMICVQSEHQSVTKSFQVDLPMGGAKSAKKRVKYTNPYAVRKSFTIQTNRPDLIHFKEHEFELNPGDSYSLGLYFLPRHERIAADILVFINNGQDENEETFSIRVSFS